MSTHGDGQQAAALPAEKLRAGDELLLGGFVRRVVHVEKTGIRVAGAPGEIQLRVSFVNGGSITVPSSQVFDVVSGADR